MTRIMKAAVTFVATLLALQPYLANVKAQGVLPGRLDTNFGVGGIATSIVFEDDSVEH